jgi:hypothetical protein
MVHQPQSRYTNRPDFAAQDALAAPLYVTPEQREFVYARKLYGSADLPAGRGLTIQVKTGAEQTGDDGVQVLGYAGWRTILLKFIEFQPVEGVRPARQRIRSPGCAAGFRIVA